MKVEVFKEAQEAYSKGDYKTALEGFIACTHDVAGLAPADLSKFYHLIGNCYVKSNDPRSAAEYYLKALTGPDDCLPIHNVTFEPGYRNNWHIHHANKKDGPLLQPILREHLKDPKGVTKRTP